MLEGFALSDDEHRLDYTLNVPDPATLIEPLTACGHWVWARGETGQVLVLRGVS